MSLPLGGPKEKTGNSEENSTRLAERVVNQDQLHGKVLDVPDYALDKHTARGKSMGRGVQHWREEGCVLVPGSDVEDPYGDRAYEYWDGDFVKTRWGKRGTRRGKAGPEQASLF